MADDCEDDQWLYGDTPDLNTEDGQKDPELQGEQIFQSDNAENQFSSAPTSLVHAKEPIDDGPPGVDNEPLEKETEGDETQQNEGENPDGMEDGEVRQNGDDSDKEDLEDDSDDDVNVVIGDIKATTPSYTALNIKRGGLLTSVGDKSKQTQQQQQAGKFVVEEFEQIGTINGVPAIEYNIDAIDDKPWRKPGADITDYFNYGFNEDTWKAYCERQRRIRLNESGVGLVPNSTGLTTRVPVPIMNDNSKYTNNFLGTQQRPMMPNMKPDQTKINTIQVMTADRREYSRKPSNFPDVTVPPPGATFEAFQPEYGFNPEPEPFYGGYEPTQDSQWTNEPPPGWTPTELKTLTGPPPMGPPSMHMGPPPAMRSPSRRDSSPHKDRDRDRERESRSRSEKPRDRERERSHRRDRSRSRSRRHKSRSRSPSHRSHRKKKSRRHDDSD